MKLPYPIIPPPAPRLYPSRLALALQVLACLALGAGAVIAAVMLHTLTR